MKERKSKNDKIIDFNEARDKRRAKREAELEKRNRKVARLNRVKEKPSRREIIRNNRIRYLIFFASLFLLLLLGVSMFSIVDLKIQENKALALQEKLKTEKENLQHELTLVNTPEYIEQQARMQLKMIKPGEILYVFPEDAEKAVKAE